jgi:hypothetical protein
VPAADLGKYDRTLCAGIMAGANCTVGCAGDNVLSPGTARTTFRCSIDPKTKRPVWDAKPKWPVCVRMLHAAGVVYCNWEEAFVCKIPMLLEQNFRILQCSEAFVCLPEASTNVT